MVGAPAAPAHTMVVVKTKPGVVTIRGFNNFGTLGTGTKDTYDNADRNLADNKYWHAVGPQSRLGMSFSAAGPAHLVAYAQYYANSQTIRRMA